MEDIPREHHLLPSAIDWRAQHTPDKLYVYLPKGENLEDGYLPFTFRDLAKAVDATSWWLDEVLGGPASSDDFPTVPYIGPNDIRYGLLAFAAMKTRRKLLNPFPANTSEGFARLLKATDAAVVLAPLSHQDKWKAVLDDMLDSKPLLINVPPISHFIHDQTVEHYRFFRDLEAGLHDPTIVSQSSGTTGVPKPIVFEYSFWDECFRKWAEYTYTAPLDEKLAQPALLRDCYMPNFLAFSFAAGHNLALIMPITLGNVSILMPSTMPQPMTSEYALSALQNVPKGAKNGAVFIPDILRAAVKSDKFLGVLQSSLDWVGFAGAPLDDYTGNLITAKGVRVQSMGGQTDTSAWAQLLNNPADWKYERFLPGWGGFHFQEYGDGLFELCVKKQGPHDHRHAFVSNPGLDVFHTSDVFRPVPGRPGFMESAGRVDDFVRLTNWTRVNTTGMETIINRSPHVERCMIAGNGRPQPFAIIQPVSTISNHSQESLLDLVWSAVEQANEIAYAQVRLRRELVLITAADKPLPLTEVKRGVNKREVLKLYAKEIEDAYLEAGHGVLNAGADALASEPLGNHM